MIALPFVLSSIFYLIYVRKNTKVRRFFVASIIVCFIMVLLGVFLNYLDNVEVCPACEGRGPCIVPQGCYSMLSRLPFINILYFITVIAPVILVIIGLVMAKKSHYKIWPYFVMLSLPVIYYLAAFLYISFIYEV